MIADEEQEHKAFTKVTAPEPETRDEVATEVLTTEMKKQISAAGFEAAAISAAIDFETKAVELYSSRAERDYELCS